MFNDKTNKKRGKFTAAIAGAAVVAMALTFGYATVADAQMRASVSKPVLRGEYKGSDMLDLSGVVNLRNGNQKISVSLRDSDLKSALRMIADKAGLNVIFHSSVEGSTVTLDLVNVTLNDAFKMVMQACDLSYVIEDGTLIVMTKEASLTSDIAKQNMMTIPVKFADASKVADFLNSNVFSTNRPGLSNSKIVVTNPVTNELILFGTMNDYKMAQKVVAKIDVAPKTISYRVNHTTPKEMATLICKSLFPTATVGGEAGTAGEGNKQSGGAGGSVSAGTMTGGATSSGGSGEGGSGGSGSGGSGSASGSSGGNKAEDISLGKGVVACSIKGDVENDRLKSLAGTSLTVTYFQQKGTINITGGSDAQAEMIKDFIKANDKKQPQAFIEMQIVELSEEGSREFNNTWHIMTPFFAGGFSDGALTNTNPMFFTGGPYTTTTVDSTGQTITTKTFDRYHGKNMLGWTISYLVENNKGRILANPKLLVTNGKKSLIDLTSDYVKSVDEEIMSGTSGWITGVTRTYEIGDDMGISIEFTPFISPDGYVTLNLAPNYATLKEEVTSYSVDPNRQGIPIIAATLLQRRNMELSNVRIKDGETLVLGGMIQEEERKQIAKFPFLGDLPVIGAAFRNTSTTNTKSELVIMVTPHIVKDTEDVANNDTESL